MKAIETQSRLRRLQALKRQNKRIAMKAIETVTRVLDQPDNLLGQNKRIAMKAIETSLIDSRKRISVPHVKIKESP